MVSCVPSPHPLFCSMMGKAYLGQFWLGEARLAHLGGLAHGHITLCEGTLRKGLRGHILAGLAVGKGGLAGPRKPKAVLLAAPTASLAFWSAPT